MPRAFKLDSNVLYCWQFDEVLATAAAMDRAGRQSGGVAQAGSPAALQPGPIQWSRRVTPAGAYFENVSNYDFRTDLAGDCTVEVLWKGQNHSTPLGQTRTILSMGRFNDFYCNLYYVTAGASSILRIRYLKSDNATYVDLSTGVAVRDDVFVMYQLKKTVTAPGVSPPGTRLNTYELWATPVGEEHIDATPAFSATGQGNPGASSHAAYIGLGRQVGVGNNGDGYLGGIRISKVARTFAELDESFFDATIGETVVPVPTPSPLPPVPAPFVGSDASAEATDFGLDVSTFPDLDAAMALSNEPTLLSQAILRRLSTPHGALSFHPDYGFDLRQFCNETVTDELLFRIKAGVEQEVEQEERIESAVASVRFEPSTETLYIGLELETAEGPFSLVLAANQLAVTLVPREA